MNKSAPIVVAVGLTDSDAALQYAAHEAVISEAPLHLVHVLQVPANAASAAGVYQGVLEESNATLDTAVRRARALTDGLVEVTSECLDQASLRDTLVRSADQASQIVLQHRHLSQARRFFTNATVSAVAARSHVPVVVVPPGWQAATERPVTAAVQDALEAPHLLHTAYEEAQRRGAPVTILHAWWLRSGYDVVAVDDEYRQQRALEFEHELEPIIESLNQEWPSVRTTVEIVHAPAAEALLDASVRSDLLVIGRRHHLLPLGSHLGPVARAVVHHSECPVVIAPEVPSAPEDARSSDHHYQSGLMY